MLKEKYQELLGLGARLDVKGMEVREEGGKLSIKGTTTYQLEKDLFWDKVKSFANWDKELAVDLRVERKDLHGIHTVQPGETLSKLAKLHLDDAKRYNEIFEANRDLLTNPDMIKVGQKLRIPNR